MCRPIAFTQDPSQWVIEQARAAEDRAKDAYDGAETPGQGSTTGSTAGRASLATASTRRNLRADDPTV